ncbi:MAG: glycosyltransferase family 39 protein [Planctomycetes bacterium]|nr:glycosyltransferase family 39 protein [Planctomycetota bacterium]
MRLFVCLRTPMPGRDGVAYLWMGQQWQHGDLGGLFGTVFHPLYPFLVGSVLRVWPGLDVVAAGQLVAAGCGALAVVPIWMATRRLFGDRAAVWAGFAYAIGTWFVRHPAECMSEGPFYLLAALWAHWLLRERPRAALAGIAAGVAFLARPEGAAMAATACVHLALTRRWSGAARHALAAFAAGALLPLGYLAFGHGLTLTPKAAFNWNVGAGGADDGITYYLLQWLRLPGDAIEGLGYITALLMLGGAIWLRPRRRDDPRWLLLLPFLLQCAVIPLLKSHHRFLSGFGVLLLPFAGAAFVGLLDRLRARRPWLPWLAIAVLIGSEARLWLDRPTDRTIERDLGRALAAELQSGEVVVSDMPRLEFFAGQRPPPPAPIPAAAILEIARQPRCRFVALKRGRTDVDPQSLAALGLAPVPLPAAVAAHPAAADVLLFGRAR